MRATQKRVTFGPTTAKFFGLAVLAILAFMMLGSSTKSATDPYSQNQLRKEISQEQQEIDSLKLQAQRYQAVDAIQSNQLKEQMQPIGDPEYVEKGDVAGVSTTRQ